MKLSRRGLFQGIFGAAVAPLAAKVAAALPAPKTIEWKTLFPGESFYLRTSIPQATWRELHDNWPYGRSSIIELLSQSNEIFDDLPYTGESAMRELIECDDCEGTGKVEQRQQAGDYKVVQCPTCEGSGEIEVEEEDDVE